jgi:hypothetical protein
VETANRFTFFLLLDFQLKRGETNECNYVVDVIVGFLGRSDWRRS